MYKATGAPERLPSWPRWDAEHIAIIVVVDLVPIQSHFRSRRPEAQQPLYQDGHTATGPAQDGHRPEG